MMMDIINTDAEDTNLLTLLSLGSVASASTARVLAFSLSRRLPSFGPRAEVTNSSPSAETADW
jgi:hypothetical protein